MKNIEFSSKNGVFDMNSFICECDAAVSGEPMPEFTEEEEQRIAASLFNTNLPELTTAQEKEKAFHDILYAVKKNSYEFFAGRLGADVNALTKVIAGKKALEELAKTHISLD